MQFDWKTRVGLVLSAVWICLVFLFADRDQRFTSTLATGTLPLALVWGIGWSVKGWLTQRAQRKSSSAPTTPLHRRPTVKSFIAIVMVLVLGLFCANWQLDQVSAVGRNDIPRWVGEWGVYGLIAYVLFRFVPRLPFGLAPVLASLVVIGGVNFEAYRTVSLVHDTRAALTKAVPFLSRVSAGQPLTDSEVENANLGMFQELILVEVRYVREVQASGQRYQNNVQGLAAEEMLAPATLRDANGRESVKARLNQWRQAANQYSSEIRATTAQAKLGARTAVRSLPSAVAAGAVTAFEGNTDEAAAFVEHQMKLDLQSADVIESIVGLIEQNQSSIRFVAAPVPNLIFANQDVLDKYKGQLSELNEISVLQQQGRTSYLDSQTRRTNEIADFMK